jgi:outer membrane receptor for ferrienterochelin and colicins
MPVSRQLQTLIDADRGVTSPHRENASRPQPSRSSRSRTRFRRTKGTCVPVTTPKRAQPSSAHRRTSLAARFFLVLVVLPALRNPLAAQTPQQSDQQQRQQPPSQDLSKLNLEDLMNISVYSASKRVQNSSDAPSSVTVITADEIQKYGYRSLSDILESVRGFYVTYDRDYSFVGVRGFGRLGDSNNRLLVLIDGHRINDNVFGQPYLGTEFLVDIDMIERVEIIRGPSSSLYGADAFFAVINVITRKAPQLKGAELSFADASYDSFQGRASYGGRFHDFDVALSGAFYNSQGPTLFFPEFDNPATNNGITRNTDYEDFQHLIGTVSFHGFTVQGLYSSRDKGVPTGYFGAVFNDPRTKNLDRHQYVDLSYRHSLGDTWDIAFSTSYDHASLQAPLVFATGLPDDSTTIDTYSFLGEWWDNNVQLSRTLLDKHKITFGTEIIDNFKQNQSNALALDQSVALDPENSIIWALFAQDEFGITPKLILSAGVRYDHYSQFGGTTNPRLGLIYHVARPTTLKLLYGTAFRAPEPFEVAPDFSSFDNNRLLRPETIRNVEGVIEQSLSERFTLTGDVFHSWIKNLITVVLNLTDGNSIYENSGRVNSTGAEVELNVRLAGGIQGHASYSYTVAHQPPPLETLANSPRHLGKLNLSVQLVRQRLFASLDAQYTSSVQTLAGNTISGFGMFNVTALGHVFSKHLDLSASVYNLLDKKYFNPGRPEDPEDAIQQDGRTFRLKLTTHF